MSLGLGRAVAGLGAAAIGVAMDRRYQRRLDRAAEDASPYVYREGPLQRLFGTTTRRASEEFGPRQTERGPRPGMDLSKLDPDEYDLPREGQSRMARAGREKAAPLTPAPERGNPNAASYESHGAMWGAPDAYGLPAYARGGEEQGRPVAAPAPPPAPPAIEPDPPFTVPTGAIVTPRGVWKPQALIRATRAAEVAEPATPAQPQPAPGPRVDFSPGGF